MGFARSSFYNLIDLSPPSDALDECRVLVPGYAAPSGWNLTSPGGRRERKQFMAELMVSLSVCLRGGLATLWSQQTQQLSRGQAGNWAFVAKCWVLYCCFSTFMQIMVEKSLYFIQLTGGAGWLALQYWQCCLVGGCPQDDWIGELKLHVESASGTIRQKCDVNPSLFPLIQKWWPFDFR